MKKRSKPILGNTKKETPSFNKTRVGLFIKWLGLVGWVLVMARVAWDTHHKPKITEVNYARQVVISTGTIYAKEIKYNDPWHERCRTAWRILLKHRNAVGAEKAFEVLDAPNSEYTSPEPPQTTTPKASPQSERQ